MAFFIALMVTLAWGCLMVLTARNIFAGSVRFKRLKTGVVASCLAVLPFGHELYVYYGLQAFCDLNGGIVKLEPVVSDSLSFDVARIVESKLLAHPSLRNVQYAGNEAGRSKKAVRLRALPHLCREGLHLGLANSPVKLGRNLALQAESRGLCYSENENIAEPRYSLKAGAADRYLYRPSNSVWYPRDIRNSVLVELVDTSTGATMSRYERFQTKPGWLANLLIPQMKTYECSGFQQGHSKHTFPFQDDLYVFLQEAVVGEAGEEGE